MIISYTQRRKQVTCTLYPYMYYSAIKHGYICFISSVKLWSSDYKTMLL